MPPSRLATPLAFHAFSRLLLALFLLPAGSDVPLYFSYASRGRPYADFRFEYPPLAYLAVAWPEWANPGGPANEYRLLFRLLMAACETTAAALIAMAVRIRRPGTGMDAAAAWGLMFQGAALAPVLLDRLDAGVLVSFATWAYACARIGGGEGARWVAVGAAALGLGAAYKWVPIVAVPYFLLGLDGRHRMVATGVLFFTLGLPFAFALLVGGRAALEFLSYNAARGLEAESAWASLLLLLRPGTRAAQGPGSWDLAGPWAGLLAHLSAAVVGVLLLLLLLRMILFRRTSFPSQRAYRTSLLAVLLAGTLSKVLSPQYLVWLLPLLALAGAESLPTAAHLALFSLLGTAAALLTTWVFPYHFVAGGTGMPPWDGRRVLIRADGPEGEVDGWVALVMAARNAGLLGMVVWVGLPLLRR